MKQPVLEGIIAATVLPMTVDQQVDTAALVRYFGWLLDQGVGGLAVNVDTGEGPHLARAEALHVLETAATVAGGRVPIVAGLGSGATRDVVAAARDYRAAGADALLVFPSSTFRGLPLPAELPLAYYRAIGEGADIPLVLFQLQDALGGVEFPLETLVSLAALPHVVAIKEATFDKRRFSETVSALDGSDIRVLTGNDNFIYESFRLGARGALIGFGTLAVADQVEMVRRHEAGEAERSAGIGERIQRLADVIFAPPVRDYRVRLKEALTMLGVIPRATARLPLLPVSKAEQSRIRAALVAAGLDVPAAPRT